MKKTAFALLSVLVLLLACSCTTIEEIEKPDTLSNSLKLRFFSFEGTDDWGDCTFIQFPNGENMMIDFGYAEVGDFVANELKAQGITHIDYAVFTHCHSDHTHGYKNLQSAGISFGKALTTGYHPKNYAWLSESFQNNGMEEIILGSGDSFDIGDVHFDVLWPVSENLDFEKIRQTKTFSGGSGMGSTEEINSNSLVMKMTYGDFSVLFCADIYKAAETGILEIHKDNPSILDCDVIKIMHHGNPTSSSSEFVNAASPDLGVVMGSDMNIAVFKTFYEAGATVYQSYYNGNIYIESNGKGYSCTADRMGLPKTFETIIKLMY